jgi:two-component system nitrogen regulation response regulator GlnG
MKPVWIIDDDRSIRWVFEKALARENLPHQIFDSADDGAARPGPRHSPALVSDIRMPGMNGLEFMDRIKARASRSCRSSS